MAEFIGMPPGWMVPVRGMDTQPVRINSSTKTHHFERVHFGSHSLDMKQEIDVGLMPKDWSVSSAMQDPRPNGRALFDARFIQSPLPRHKAGMKMSWDAQGLANAAADTTVANMSVDPTDKDFQYGKIGGLSRQQIRDLATLDDFDVDVRAAKAEERMGVFDDAAAANTSGSANYWS